MTDCASSPPHILVVDDSGGVRRALESALSPYMRVTLAESVAEARARLTPCVQLVLSDIRMPEESGFDLAEYLKRHHPEVPLVLFTGVVDAETRLQAQRLGIEVLRKPLPTEQLLKVIQGWVGDLPGHRAGLIRGQAKPPEDQAKDRAEQQQAEQEQADPLGDLCRKPGVLSAALFTEAGQVTRQWKLPFPPELVGQTAPVFAGLEGCAGLLGSEWPESHLMQLPLSDRVLLLGRVAGQRLALVVRDMAGADEVRRGLAEPARTSGRP